MISLWMLYSAAIATLVCIGAAGLHRVATAYGKPTRFIWMAALAASILWPTITMVRRATASAPAAAGGVKLVPFPAGTVPAPVRSVNLHPSRLATNTNFAIVVLWAAATVVLLIRLGAALIVLRRRRATWRREQLDGVEVRLSTDIGPAVVGIGAMDVVLPEWILSLDRPLLSLVLRHEQEHRAARDPYLLLGAAMAVVLMPWNLALWWQARRLRFAVEIDCDARVLRADPRPERYGMLLLTIAQRRSLAPSVFAPMLSEPTTQLEQRIDAMRNRTGRVTRLSILGGLAATVLAIAVACTVNSPDNVTGPRPAPMPTRMTADQVYFEYQVEVPVTPKTGNPSPRYPDMLRTANVEGEVLAQFVVDEKGVPDMNTYKVLKATHPMFADVVAKAMPVMSFNPALVGGRPVKQLVQMPFQFGLTKETAARSAALRDTLRSRGISEVKVTGAMSPEAAKLRALRRDTLEQKFRSDTAAARDSRGLTEVPVGGIRKGVAPRSVNADETYYEFQVEKPVSPKSGTAAPRYPAMLFSANVEGEVLAQFVVGTDGRPDVSSFKMLRETHPLFTQAVKEALPNMQFAPAEVGGKYVKQLVQMPFRFDLKK